MSKYYSVYFDDEHDELCFKDRAMAEIYLSRMELAGKGKGEVQEWVVPPHETNNMTFYDKKLLKYEYRNYKVSVSNEYECKIEDIWDAFVGLDYFKYRPKKIENGYEIFVAATSPKEALKEAVNRIQKEKEYEKSMQQLFNLDDIFGDLFKTSKKERR